MKFAGRLVAGTILVLVVTMLIVVVTADRSLRADIEEDVREALEREALLVADALPADSTRWPALVRRLSADLDHRITLVDRTGRVVAESGVAPGELARIPNHRDRPEVQGALEGRATTSRRQSSTTGVVMFYTAVPGGPGVVRVASDLAAVDGLVRTAQRSVLGAALLALVIGVLLAAVAGRSIARPLHEIATSAHAMARGEPPRFPRSGIPDVDELVQALREMHEQLGQRFEALRHEKAESAALVDAMVEGVLASDGRGRIVRANPAARRLLGYGDGEPLPDLRQLFRAKAARAVVDTVLAGSAVQDRELDLDSRVLLTNARPLPGGGAVVVLHDLTEMRRLEAVRRDFVANASHELKTPLTSISGYAETLLGGGVDPATARRFLETILSNARRMQLLVDDQLDLSRIESGRWQPRIEVIEARVLVEEAWASCAERARSKGVGFAVTVADGAARLSGDRDGLRQVLVNLFDNAVRHTPSGGQVRCEVAPSGGGFRLAVSDTGSGIARDHLPRIFERFYRADPARSREEGGTGLGLAIVKHLVEAHDGTVRAESSLGAGTTIIIWIPGTPLPA